LSVEWMEVDCRAHFFTAENDDFSRLFASECCAILFLKWRVFSEKMAPFQKELCASLLANLAPYLSVFWRIDALRCSEIKGELPCGER
ncbi:hypothetical protein, partial [Porphyromonas loveana]|uniref:hypothetical protein n=1 Tax=Porphyromonas loveana TaxID=1884669 RepID=UPI0035A1A0A5